MQYRAEMNYTLKDMRQFEKVHQKLRSKIAFYAARILLIVATLMVLAAGAVLLVFRAFDGEMIRIYVLLVVMYALWFAARELRVRTALKNLMSKGCVTLRADEEGIHIEMPTIASSVAYASYRDLVHSGETYYLYIDKRQANILPERCFTEGDPAAFGKFIEEKTGLKVKEIK